MPKKRKYVSISDRKSKKPWALKKAPTKYQIGVISTNDIVLIITEGQTEKLYFESFPVLGLTVKAIDLGGQSKLKMIEATENIVKNSKVKFDKIFCVFDMDVKKGENEYSSFDSSIEKGESLGYNVIYSNDAFELWYYLHYSYTDAENHREFYYAKLSEVFDFNYKKEGKKYDTCTKFYSFLITDERASQSQAIIRAKKLYEEKKHLPYHKQNPITKVYLLVEYLNNNLKN